MQFETKAQQTAYEKVAGFMKELFGEVPIAVPDAPVFVFQMGSTLTHVAVHPWGDDEATVNVRAYVVYGADLRPDCLKFLLEENNKVRYGAFGVDSDGDIFFEHAIVGSTLDKQELKASTLAVATAADHYDEQIVARWGGMRTADKAKR